MALLFAIGGEGYTDAASINANPNWSSAGSVAAPQTILSAAPNGERWFEGGGDIIGTAAAPNAAAFEVSFGVVLSSVNSVKFATIRTDAAVQMEILSLNGNIHLWPGGGSAAQPQPIDTGFTPTLGQAYYIVYRSLNETTAGAGDGEYQLWIDGTNVYSQTNVTGKGNPADTITNMSVYFLPQTNAKLINMVAYDAWVTSGASPYLRVSDDPGFVGTPIYVSNTYYSGTYVPLSPVPLVRAIGGAGFTTNASIVAHPDWSTLTTNTVSVARSYLSAAPPGERWIESDGADSKLKASMSVYNPVETEISFGYRYVNNGSSQVITEIRSDGIDGDSNAFNESPVFALYAQSNADTYISDGAVGNFANGAFTFEENRTYYVTFRVRYLTSVTGNDMDFQLWIDGNLAHEETNIPSNASFSHRHSSPDINALHFWFDNNTSSAHCNITVKDAWSSADAVAPSALRVTDTGNQSEPTELTDVVPYTYYYAPEVPVPALGGEGYTDPTSISETPGWSASSVSASSQTWLSSAPAGEKWFTPFSSSYGYLTYAEEAAAPTELEWSFGFRMQDITDGYLGWISVDSSVATNIDFLDFEITTAGALEVLSYDGAASDFGGAVGGFAFENDKTYYITIRLRHETSALNDGLIQVWANQVLIYEATTTFTGVSQGVFGANITRSAFDMYPRDAHAYVNISFLDSFQTADSVAPPVLKVTDGANFANTTSVVPLTYYYEVSFPAPNLLRSISGNGYTDETSIDANPNWDAYPDVTAKPRQYLVGKPPGERWFESPNNTSASRVTSTPQNVSGLTNWEASCAVHFGDGWGGDAETILLITNKSGGILTTPVYIGASAGQLVAGIGAVGYYTNDLTPFAVAENEQYYITLRVIPSTGGASYQQTAGNPDGTLEIWANGVLAFKKSNVNLGWSAQTDATQLQVAIGVQYGNFQVSNITLYDGFTSPDGTAPVVTSVTDEAAFATTVAEVPLSYYALLVTLKSAIGGFGYTDNTSVAANPNYTVVSNFGTFARDYLSSDPVGERWFGDLSSTGSLTFDNSTPNQTELELSFGWHPIAVNNNTTMVAIGTTPAGELSLQATATNELRFFNGSAVNTGFTIVPERPYYVTIRIKFETTASAGDGHIQLWLNNTLAYEDAAVTFAALAPTDTMTASYFTLSSGQQARFLNITSHDTWRADAATPSSTLIVSDDAGFVGTTSEVPLTYYYEVPPANTSFSYMTSPGNVIS